MPLDDLLQSLTRRTDAEVAALLAAAHDEAAGIRREADRRSADRSAVLLREHTRVVTDAMERAVALAVRAERGAELNARARTRDRIFTAVRDRLAAVGQGEAYRNSLAKRFGAAAAAVGDEAAEVRCAPGLESALAPLLAGHSGLRVATDPAIVAGFLIHTDDGRLVVDETLEHRLAAETGALSLAAVRALGEVR